VLGVVHRFPGADGSYLDFKSLSAEEMAEIEFRLSMGMIRNAPIDVLGHPGGMYQRRHGAFPEALFREMMLATRERGIAIEINTSYLVDIPSFIALCAEIDPIVSIGSDAHQLQELAHCRDTLVQMGIGRP
jgi:putative hydrolase